MSEYVPNTIKNAEMSSRSPDSTNADLSSRSPDAADPAVADMLRRFADSTTVYTYVVDDATDEILMVNDHYAKNLGVSASAMEGQKCWAFVMGADGGRCPFCPRRTGSDNADSASLHSFNNGSSSVHSLNTGAAVATHSLNPPPCTPLIDTGSAAYSFDTAAVSVEAFNPTLGIWGKCTGQGITWTDGQAAHVVTIIDISEEKLLKEELSRLAYYDKRMGIANRAKLEKDITARPDDNYCLIAFDYISLRYINDAYGRPLVNALLDAVVAWIRSFDIQNFEIYRTDSDEFCLLMDYTDMQSASGLAGRIQERFQEPWEVSIDGETTTISCRVAVCVVDGRLGFENAEDMLSIIGRTLDIAKNKQSVSVYDKNLDATLKRDLALEISLKNCVQENMQGFDVYFQPIVDTRRRTWIGLEALCRWDSPEFGRIPPLVFINIAEQIGVINKIGYWVLDTAIDICAALGLSRVEGFFLDVNLSPFQMSDETLIRKTLSSLQEHSFPAQCLSLDVTGSQNLEPAGYSHTTIERLKSLDIRIALDDFGTGYSNFNNLRSLPVSVLKTEKAFIDNIVTDDYQQFLMKMLVDLAHEARMSLIAEGVETIEQMRELLKTGADYLQGYLFAKPLSSAELTASVRRFREPDGMFALAESGGAADPAGQSPHTGRHPEQPLAGTGTSVAADPAESMLYNA